MTCPIDYGYHKWLHDTIWTQLLRPFLCCHLEEVIQKGCELKTQFPAGGAIER